MRRIKVQCTLIIELDWPDENVDPYFQIEENSCPGTSSIGAIIDDAIAKGHDEGTCWACALQGENKILSIQEVQS